jgi:hypothetical protein
VNPVERLPSASIEQIGWTGDRVLYVVDRLNAPGTTAKDPDEARVPKRRIGLDDVIASIALSTDLPVRKGEPNDHADISANGTCRVSPSMHTYPDVDIGPAVHAVGTLMTASLCDKITRVCPSGALTVTANWASPAPPGAVVPTMQWPTDTECAVASYVYATTVPWVVDGLLESTHETAPDASTSKAFGVFAS